MIRYALLIAFSGSLAACGSAENATPTQVPSPNPLAEESVLASAEGALPTTAQGFVDVASGSDIFEVEAGKLAQDMAKSQAVKDFGAMMLKDHTKSTADLKAAAAKIDGIIVSPKLSASQQADLEALKMAGEGFDSAYKAQQVAAHEKALSLLQRFRAGGDAEPLKEFASKTAPVVEGHLAHVRGLP
jgi:putative membrane protein